MTRLTFVSAAMIALTLFTSGAMAARSEAAARHGATRAHRSAMDCVRAPNVGAFATDPYTIPPCMPNGAFR